MPCSPIHLPAIAFPDGCCGRTTTKCIQSLLCLRCGSCILLSYCDQCCHGCWTCASNWNSFTVYNLWRNFFAYLYHSPVYTNTIGCRPPNGITIKNQQ